MEPDEHDQMTRGDELVARMLGTATTTLATGALTTDEIMELTRGD